MKKKNCKHEWKIFTVNYKEKEISHKCKNCQALGMVVTRESATGSKTIIRKIS